MDGFWLVFKDAELERTYNHYNARAQDRTLDGWFLNAEALVQIATAIALKSRGQLTQEAGAAMGVNLAALGGVTIANQKGRMAAVRTPALLCYRMVRTICGAVSARSAACETFSRGSNPLLGLLRGLIAPRATHWNMTTFGCRLSFRHHFLHQLLESMLCCIAHVNRSCECAVESPDSWIFVSTEHFLRAFTSPVAAFAHGLNASVMDRGPGEACAHLLSWIDVYIGVIVSYMLWVSERRSRCDFLKSLQNDGRRGGPRIDNWEIGWQGHLWFIMVVFVVIWEHSEWIPTVLGRLMN